MTSKAWIEASLPGAYPSERISRQALKLLPPPPALISPRSLKPALPARPKGSNIKDPVMPYTGPTDKTTFLKSILDLNKPSVAKLLRSMGARVGVKDSTKEELKAFGVTKVSVRCLLPQISFSSSLHIILISALFYLSSFQNGRNGRCKCCNMLKIKRTHISSSSTLHCDSTLTSMIPRLS